MSSPSDTEAQDPTSFSDCEAIHRSVSSFLVVTAIISSLSLFPLAAHYLAVFGRDNSLDKDPIVEVMVFMVLTSFAGANLIALLRIRWIRGYSVPRSASISVWGPLVWFHGHHRPIPEFYNHEISIRNMLFCCGCNGAVMGIIIGIVFVGLTELSFFSQVEVWFMFLVGLFSVAVALAPYGVNANPTPLFRLSANTILPIGLCLIFASVRLENPSSNLVLLLGGLVLATFLFARIWLSGRSHARIGQLSRHTGRSLGEGPNL